jgi:hypothetical protein
MHVESVLGDVKPTERCRCREKRADRDERGRSWWSALLGKKDTDRPAS